MGKSTASDEIESVEERRARRLAAQRKRWEAVMDEFEIRHGRTDRHGTPWREIFPCGTDETDIRRGIRPREVVRPAGSELEQARQAAYDKLRYSRNLLADAEREFADLGGDEAQCAAVRERDSRAQSWWTRFERQPGT